VHQLKHPEEFTDRYQELLSHYGLKASHSQAGKAHENGDVEQAHFRFKQAVEQELILRGSRDFTDRETYESFLAEVIKRRNAARAKRLVEELKQMRRLPARRLEDFTRQRVKVSRESTIRVRHNTYSVDSRLRREWVEVRIFADRLAIWYGQRKIDEIPRLRGAGKHRIQYRHVIHSLVKKPGAFERYRYREDLFPSLLFRVAYDELREDCPGTGARQYLRILLWAAEISEERVERSLKLLIEQGRRIRADEVWESLKQDQQGPEKWQVSIRPVEVAEYDHLLEYAQEVAS
jgi:ribosomal protein S21